MATRKPNPVTLQREAIEEAFSDDRDEPRELPDEQDYVPPWSELDRLKTEFSIGGEEISFQIFRQGPGGHKDLSFIRSVAPDQFSYELLQSEPFNGGGFRVYIRNNSGIKRNFFVSVEKPVSAAVAPVAVQNDALAIAMAQLANTMQSGFSQMAAMVQQAKPAGMGVEETIKLLAALTPLTARSAAPPERDPLELLTRMLEIQKTIAPPVIPEGGDVGGAIMLEGIRSFGPLLRDLMNRQGGAPAAPGLPALPNPAVTPNPITPEPPIEEESEMSLLMKMYAGPILLAAANDMEPGPYADILLNHFSDEQIAQYINAPDWFEQLCGVLPAAGNHRAWFDKLRAEVQTILQTEPDSDTLPQPGSQ